MAIKMRHSTDNIFRDLKFSPAEAESLRIRAELMSQMIDLIENRKLTQKSAARLFGVTQPRVSDLVRGKIGLFSIEGLVDMLTRAGIRVLLRTEPVRATGKRKAA